MKKKSTFQEIEKKDLIDKACLGYEKLAFANSNDAIKLIFVENLTEKELSKMDLFNVSEIKKLKDGAIEIKFFDRLKALEKLEQADFDTRDEVNPFYYALEKGIESLKGC